MIIIRFALPLIYSLIVGFSYSALFKKKFIESVAPAFFLQMIVMLLVGMMFQSISLGIVIFIILTFVVDFFVLRKKARRTFLLNQLCVNYIDSGFLFFVICYVFIYIINYGSHFSSWDEFSHWGIFIKESLRLDALYCTSPLDITHKDYVPVITLFETLWCKLSLRYSEADAYRGIQMFQMSMILPMLFQFNKAVNERSQKIVRIILRLVIVICIPLFFTNQELFFYHTIYQDYVFGILIFYAVYVIFAEIDEEGWYHSFVVTLALTVLVLAKMVAAAYLPLLWLLFIIVAYRNGAFKKIALHSWPIVVVPAILWVTFNSYVDKYVPNNGSGQSYDGISISKILGILFHDGSVGYQYEIDKKYWDALWNTPIIGELSYLPVVIIIFVGLFLFARTREDKKARKSVDVLNIFNLCSALMYALMMYVLYLTAFTEYEASYLASYSRYMSTAIFAILYSAVFGIIMYSEWNPKNGTAIISIWTAIFVVIGTCKEYEQIIPGAVLGERAKLDSETEYVLKNVAEDKSVYIVNKGDNGFAATVMRYSCWPINISWGSPGDPEEDGNIYSVDYSIEELYEIIIHSDYVYFMNVDEAFIKNYSQLFDKPAKIITGKMYKVSENGTTIMLEDCMDL